LVSVICFLFSFFFFLSGLGMELWASPMLSRCSTSEPQPQSWHTAVYDAIFLTFIFPFTKKSHLLGLLNAFSLKCSFAIHNSVPALFWLVFVQYSLSIIFLLKFPVTWSTWGSIWLYIFCNFLYTLELWLLCHCSLHSAWKTYLCSSQATPQFFQDTSPHTNHLK
jgi:hypothetical protein